MQKIIFISIATVSLLAQIANPLWWLLWFFSIGSFLASIFSLAPIPIWILAAIMLVVIFIIPIWSIIFAIKLKNEEIYNYKKNKYFLIINIITVILSSALIVYNGGFEVHMMFP